MFPPLSDLLRTRRLLVFLVAGILVVAVVMGILAWQGAFAPRNPLLDSPKIALEGLQSKSLYYNGRARSWLLAQRPDLMTDEDRDIDSERSRAFPQAVQNTKLFFQLDRKYRFDALLLVGDPSEYRPLLDKLVETKVWTLRYVDHTSMVFRRDNGRAWEVGDLAPVRAKFAQSGDRQQAEVLAQTALKLVAIKQLEPAKTLLDEAARLSSREPHVGNALGTYYLVQGQWKEAVEQVNRALSSKSDFLPALATKTQLLYGMRRYNEAYEISKQLIDKYPDDPNLLFYHAKIAHEAHAYKTEAETLGKLIVQADALGLPVGGYRVYLGQAYTEMGDAQRALDAYMLSLDDPDLPADQRAFARENITRIKQRSGM